MILIAHIKHLVVAVDDHIRLRTCRGVDFDCGGIGKFPLLLKCGEVGIEYGVEARHAAHLCAAD